MNLLRVIASMNPAEGGPSQGIRNLVPQLEQIGVCNEVVSLDDPNSAFLGKDSFSINALGPCRRPWCYSSKLLPWLTNNLDRFDAVIIHGLWLYPSYATYKAMKILKGRSLSAEPNHTNLPKIYVMPHGMLDPYFQRASQRKLKAFRNWAYWKLIESKVVNEADGLLFTSEEELYLARQPFKPYKPKREIKVGYGIQLPPPLDKSMHTSFRELCPHIGDNSYLLFLSRIHEKKGADLLVKAYEVLIMQGVKMPKLVIGGPGLESSYGQLLQKLVSGNPSVRDLIFFPGMLSGNAKWGALYGCEAFVLPSHQENFGIAVVEAMACGKAVLISNKVNIWRDIQQGGGGFVEDDTSDGVQKLLSSWQELSADEKAKTGTKSKTFFQKNFTIGPAADRLLKAIVT